MNSRDLLRRTLVLSSLEKSDLRSRIENAREEKSSEQRHADFAVISSSTASFELLDQYG